MGSNFEATYSYEEYRITTQEEFDEKNRQFRMNKALAQSDGVNV